ncbi:MAG: SGNH/GDSL hydrolase family protein [Acidobacteria bacterium]|nr:SGNH/GDSL hydrolase family protein [Acidobacteriota bacterium]
MPRSTSLASILLVISCARVLAAADDDGKRSYLALGDSITFGYIAQAGWEYRNPANFVGFTDYVGAALRLRVVNAACPGETTGSFLSSTAPDNGCRSNFHMGRPLQPPLPLHVSYSSTQLDFAISYLRSHPGIRLVTIQLGADDVFLLQATCQNDPGCIASGLPSVVANASSNLHEIIRELRATDFRGIIVVVNYYSLNYADPIATAQALALNEAITTAAAERRTVVADVFTGFRIATNGGSPCFAGLLNASPQFEFNCDVHPSQSGHALIARTVEQAFETAVGEGAHQ